ncbi:MAG: rhomboid family intramembrane serine protease [Candidatus Krumholzibacteriia bacterium]
MHYYRSNSGFGSTMTPVVKNLILANVVVFMLQTVTGGGLTGRLGLLDQWFTFVPRLAIFDLQIWRFVTYMFLHGGLFHILFNMFALWMFGSQIERLWGSRTFLIYYFVCGVGGAVTYGIFNLAGMEAYIPMLGASGAVYGILLAYGLTYPDSVILIFMVVPMKAKYAVILFGFIELMSTMGSHGSSGVAHLAHLGGMVAGFIFLRWTVPALTRSGAIGGLGEALRRAKARRRMRMVRPDRDPGSRAPDQGSRTHGNDNQEQIDRILDKISREGLQSLTHEEQEILRRAGRK